MGFLRSPQFFPRRPLRPRNSLAAPAEEMDAKARGARAAAAGGKENRCRTEPGDLSLAEDLLAARKRRERLRSEWERTERALREIDLALEHAMREAERRGEEQRKLDSAVRKLVLLLDPHGLLAKDSSPFQSLRERERERKVDEDRDKGIKATDKEREVKEATRVHQKETGEDGDKEETTPKVNETGGDGDKGETTPKVNEASGDGDKLETATKVNEDKDETTVRDDGIIEEKMSQAVNEKKAKGELKILRFTSKGVPIC